MTLDLDLLWWCVKPWLQSMAPLLALGAVLMIAYFNGDPT